MGTKMFYDSISSSMDYSNRMTGLMGYAPQTMCRHELWKEWKSPPQRAHQREQNAAGGTGGRNGIRKNRLDCTEIWV